MSKGTVNKVILIGNLGRDPEVKHLDNGTVIANISIATTETKKSKSSDIKQDITEWHRLVMFGKLAEIAEQYLKKGSKVYVEGKLQTKKWLDAKTQVEKYAVEVIVESLQMLSEKSNSQDASVAPQVLGAPFDDEILF
jgi:single-strand DNA-binding protein